MGNDMGNRSVNSEIWDEIKDRTVNEGEVTKIWQDELGVHVEVSYPLKP